MERNRAQADNIIVLSFRDLQLERIGALQDRLIHFSWSGEQTDRVDEALRAYGE